MAPTTSASGVISSVYDAFRRGDISAILSQIAQDATWRQSATLPWGGDYRGPEGAAAFFRKLDQTMETVGFDVRGAVAVARNGAAQRAALVVSRTVGSGDEVLAEDPSIYVPLHRQPVVMDPFMLRRLDRQHPEWVDPLIRRISERRFALVVLVVPLDDRTLDYWWNDFQFGPRVAAALRQSYRPDGTVGRYFLYRPR